MGSVRLYILTRLSLNSDGNATNQNVGATFDIFEADAHRDEDAGNDFEAFDVSANWRQEAAQSDLIATMRTFTQIVQTMQKEALS